MWVGHLGVEGGCSLTYFGFQTACQGRCHKLDSCGGAMLTVLTAETNTKFVGLVCVWCFCAVKRASSKLSYKFCLKRTPVFDDVSLHLNSGQS